MKFMYKKARTSILVLFIVTLSASSVYATEMQSLYKGIRPLGMGNAFTAIANDENAIVYNPAGLNSIDGFGSGGVQVGVSISQSALDIAEELDDVPDDDESATAQVLKDNMGTRITAGTYGMPHITFHNFGFGVVINGKLAMDIRNPVNPYVDVAISADVIPSIAGAYSFLDNQLKVGATVKNIIRTAASERITTVDIASGEFDTEGVEDNELEGSGVGFDLGVIYNLPILENWNPTVGFVIKNVGGVDLGDELKAAGIGEEKQQVNVGFGVQGKVSFLDIRAALDYVDIAGEASDDEDLPKRLHMGIEFDAPIISIRTGLSQGYPTFGATIDLTMLKIEYASYTEELGAYAGQRPDKRQSVQLSLGWY